jgi:hypothetical protein
MQTLFLLLLEPEQRSPYAEWLRADRLRLGFESQYSEELLGVVQAGSGVHALSGGRAAER